jgi:hypothetical protein
METEACHVYGTACRKPLFCHRCNGLQGKDLSSLLFACSDAIGNGIPVNLQHRIVFQPIQSQVVIVINI